MSFAAWLAPLSQFSPAAWWPGLAPGMAWVELARVALLVVGVSLGIFLCVVGVKSK